MPEIADWLKTLSCPYAERFVESEYRHLRPSRSDRSGPQRAWCLAWASAQDVLRAIAELSDVAPTSPQPALTESKPQDTAERRQVTVMFSDLAGSTALSADLESHLLSQRRRTSEAVNQVDGRNVDVGGTASRHSLRPIASGQYPSAVTKHDQSPGILLDAGSVD
jgi:hypothetical protein